MVSEAWRFEVKQKILISKSRISCFGDAYPNSKTHELFSVSVDSRVLGWWRKASSLPQAGLESAHCRANPFNGMAEL